MVTTLVKILAAADVEEPLLFYLCFFDVEGVFSNLNSCWLATHKQFIP